MNTSDTNPAQPAAQQSAENQWPPLSTTCLAELTAANTLWTRVQQVSPPPTQPELFETELKTNPTAVTKLDYWVNTTAATKQYRYSEPFAWVLLDQKSIHLTTPVVYRIPKRMIPKIVLGAQVAVQFGRQRRHGWVVALAAPRPEINWDYPVQPIKQLLSQAPIITRPVWRLVRCWAQQQIVSPVEVLNMVIPPRRKKVETDFYADYPTTESIPTDHRLPEHGWVSLLFAAEETKLRHQMQLTVKTASTVEAEQFAPPENGMEKEFTTEHYLSSEQFAQQLVTATRADLARLDLLSLPKNTEKLNAEKIVAKAPQIFNGNTPVGLQTETIAASYPAAPAFLQRVTAGQPVRSVWTALANPEQTGPFKEIAAVTMAALQGNGNVLILFGQNQRAKDFQNYWEAVIKEKGLPWSSSLLNSKTDPDHRYRQYLELISYAGRKTTENRRVIIGTRSAVLAPIPNLRLIVVVDVCDSDYQLPGSPFWQVGKVALSRMELENTAGALISYSRSCYEQALLATGWAKEITAPAGAVKTGWAARFTPDWENRAEHNYMLGERLPSSAFQLLQRGLTTGPVLVQVPLTGARQYLYCSHCRNLACCPQCQYPLTDRGHWRILPDGSSPEPVLECGAPQSTHPMVRKRCSQCGNKQFNARQIGAEETAKQLAKSFPTYPVVLSAGEQVVESLDAQPRLVVCTPGREPSLCDYSLGRTGYAAALILDAGKTMGRVDLSLEEDLLSRWTRCAARVRTGGQIMLLGLPSARLAQTLKTFHWGKWATEELVDRADLAAPPYRSQIYLTGEVTVFPELWADLAVGPVAISTAEWTNVLTATTVYGPFALSSQRQQVVLRLPRNCQILLSERLLEIQKKYSRLRKPKIKIVVDPRP